MDAPGWHPNDSQEWERQERYESLEELETKKKSFMKTQLTRWYDEFDPQDDGETDIIKDKLSDCYNALYKELIDPYGDY